VSKSGETVEKDRRKTVRFKSKWKCVDPLPIAALAQDRARIVFDCRTANDPAMMSSTILHA